MSNYITRTTQVVVLLEDQPIFSELVTKVTIVDEGGGEFVEVGQSGHISLGKIAINPNEWPALAQQELPQKARPDFMAGYDAGMADAKRMAQQGEPVYQYQMADGSWIDQIKDSYDYNRKYAPNATVRVVYTAAPAPQAQEPVKFLAGGMRFKTSKFPGGICITGMPDELAGRWVALVAAEDNRHLQSAQPVAPYDPIGAWNKGFEEGKRLAQPVAQPLPDSWIRERTKQPWVFDTVKKWVREIEAAHGIKKARE